MTWPKIERVRDSTVIFRMPLAGAEHDVIVSSDAGPLPDDPGFLKWVEHHVSAALLEHDNGRAYPAMIGQCESITRKVCRSGTIHIRNAAADV